MIEKAVDYALAGQRFDKVLAQLFPDYSRSKLQDWLKKGFITLNGEQVTGKTKVIGGEVVRLAMDSAQADAPSDRYEAQPIALDIVHEDESLIVINKPPGLVVHPGAGNPDQTLVNALLHHAPELEKLPRAGVIHRLDKETSGLLVIARTLPAHQILAKAMEEREIKREYRAVVVGRMVVGGTVEAPISRHPKNRTQMAVVGNGKPAITHYRVLERYHFHTYLRVQLETGRTHQIRVHMAHIRYPIVGDPVYGGRLRIPAGATEELANVLRGFRRQALHAHTLGLIHPKSGEAMEWQAEIPADMEQLLNALREDEKHREGVDER
ncbi:MAG: 23S rRNA pseudouridine(1911/1915/1917) synthase RluD [Gammaproteobacteria bacterium]|nr:23S rRNA pseudouridine(1911/1915/1917) synthase RluD [Gammaproteobacteria bacterium]